MKSTLRVLKAFSLATLFAVMAVAQANGPDVTKRLDDIEKATKAAQMSGDNAWMLTSAALVLMMTGPGLALFYCGLVRRKNVLGTMMHSFVLMGLVTVLWAVVGYSLAFSEGSPFLGGFKYLFLNGVGADPNPDYAATIPQQTFMVYQLMFAIITPALISGAFAERMKFSAMLLFMTLWSLLVYSPMAHMVWGKGGFLNATLGGRFPTLEFAGGTVVHVTSGVSALVCALYLGKRVGYPARADAAAQPGAELHRRLPAVGGMVRVQRGQRAGAGRAGDKRFCGHPFWRGGGSAALDGRRSGGSLESRASWARSRERWRDWWRSRRPRASSSRCRQSLSARRRGWCAT